MTKHTKITLLTVAAVAALLLGLSAGSADVSPGEITLILANALFGIPLPHDLEPTLSGLIINIRLPRVLLAFVVGAALAVSGAVCQSVLRNPLASSYTIGVSSGAGLGAVLVIVFGLSSGALGIFMMPLASVVFGLSTVLLAIAIASRIDRNLSNFSIILVGMVLSIFVNAIMMTLATRNSHHAQAISLWQLGSFSVTHWYAVGIVAIVSVTGIACLIRYTREMDILTFGDEQAAAIGLEVRRVKLTLIMITAALTGVSVAFVGVIGFIDLIAPHVVRRLFGAAHRLVIPLSAVLGGAFMVVADTIARTVAIPSELPVGAVTALIGAPFFAYIFLSTRK